MKSLLAGVKLKSKNDYTNARKFIQTRVYLIQVQIRGKFSVDAPSYIFELYLFLFEKFISYFRASI